MYSPSSLMSQSHYSLSPDYYCLCKIRNIDFYSVSTQYSTCTVHSVHVLQNVVHVHYTVFYT